MTFTLNIECSKDIDKLVIDFSDGSSTVTEVKPKKSHSSKEKTTKSKEDRPNRPQRQEQFLDLETDYGDVSQDVVKLPDVHQNDRPVKVATEMQNLDI